MADVSRAEGADTGEAVMISAAAGCDDNFIDWNMDTAVGDKNEAAALWGGGAAGDANDEAEEEGNIAEGGEEEDARADGERKSADGCGCDWWWGCDSWVESWDENNRIARARSFSEAEDGVTDDDDNEGEGSEEVGNK